MEKYIEWVNTLDRNKLIGLAVEQRKELNDLSEDLEAQVQLNHNLIRISTERKNKERKIPTKQPGFRVVKWTETDQSVSGNMIHCYKIKVLTPYEVEAFNYRVLNSLMDSIMGNLTNLIGRFAVCEPGEVRINMNIYSETNWIWNINFEADVERDRIDMNLYCSKMPVINFDTI